MNHCGNKHEDEYEDEFLKVKTEYRTALKGPWFYFIDTYKLMSDQVSVYLHSELILPKKQKIIGCIVDIHVSYCCQTHGIRLLGENMRFNESRYKVKL